MQVDWITTIAQIINFLVLVYLLKRFLYRPIVAAMDRREAHVAERLEAAAQQSTLAQQQGDDYREKVHDFEQQREQLIEAAKREAETQRVQLMDELRSEITTIRSRWHEEVKREQQAFLDQARQMVGDQVCLVARQALGELSDAELETQMLAVFLKKLAQVPAEDKKRLAETATEKGLTVQTSFPLSPAMQEKISAMIQQQIAPALALHFEQMPALICGINLKGPGFKLEWNIESYLAHIDEQLAGRLAVASLGE
jgi:F-type H+-transporting ATPase subunit b